MKTIALFLMVAGFPALAHEIVPAQPPDGPWSVEIDYSVRGRNGAYASHRGVADSDRRFFHETANSRVGKASLQPPRLKSTRAQAASLYASVAAAFNCLEIRSGPPLKAERPLYRLARLSIVVGNRKLSFDTQQEPSVAVVAAIEKFREVSETFERE